MLGKNNHSLPHGRKGIGRLTFFLHFLRLLGGILYMSMMERDMDILFR